LQHACGVTGGGLVYCWGDNSSQQLGTMASLPICQALDGPCSPIPLAIAGGGTYTRVAASLRDTCALMASGEAWCWGLGGSGLLGCALGPAGSGYCWGPDSAGGLGNGTMSGSDTPVAVSGGLVFATLTVGDDHVCGVTTGGIGYCWGDNEYGDLGKGSAGASSVPVPIAGDLTFTMLSAGLAHTCGLLGSKPGRKPR
jgi:alpha-tubulin suppressor-like RCC1 family protein